MTYKSYDDFQYDSCSSRGICSINPRTFALQGVLVIFLKLCANYGLKLYEKGLEEKNFKNLILNAISIAVSNPEFTESGFIICVNMFKQEIPKLIKKYNEIFQEEVSVEKIELFKQTNNIIDSIKYGEKVFRESSSETSSEIRDLYQIILVIAKSMSINLLDLESLDKSYDDNFITILQLLNALNEKNKNSLIDIIKNAAYTNKKLISLLRILQEDRYGKQTEADVSFTTIPAKAVLVVGSNIRELEIVLEALQEENIDVYTHDEMMLAHTFPKFKEFSHLKGQYGQGVENCLLDFATFPGPIILTKHSLHNIENFYRGRLFTTDFTLPKGVIEIKDNNFSEVIESAKAAKGFKSGKQCETITIGYNYQNVIEVITEKLNSNNYNEIFFIGLEKYSFEQNAYFEKLIKHTPANILIISFSYNIERENLIHINTCFDSYSLIKIFDEIKKLNYPITVFMPKCGKDSVSEMIYLSNNSNTQVYVGKCTPILLNPSLMNTLQTVFNIKNITSAKKDLEDISDMK